MAKLRVGVVLLLPSPLAEEIDALRKAVGDGTFGRVPSHLTLVPPVNVRGDRMGDALSVLREAGARTRPFKISLGAPATFLPDNPVLYLPVTEGGDAVTRLRELAFRDPLARPLTWSFVPHVTVADEADPIRIEAGRVALADYRSETTFDRVHLLEEGPGRIWGPVADAAFGAPAVVGRGGLPVELSATTMLDPDARSFFEREWPVHVAAELGASRPWRKEPFAITAREPGARAAPQSGISAARAALQSGRPATVVGTAEGWTYGGIAYLDRLIVGAADRGRGIGSHLLAAFESLAAERGCRRLAVQALAGSWADAFYRSRGWSEDAVFSPWVFCRDFVQLRRDLGGLAEVDGGELP